jgi:hypothetical protein
VEVPITRLQFFVLSYLYSKELEWRNDPVRSRITKNKPQLNVEALVTILPVSIFDDNFTDANMIEELTVLENTGCLDVGMLGTSAEGFGSFSITTKGIILIKKVFAKLQSSKDKKSYEKAIDSLEGSSGGKNWLKGIWESLKNKAQDEIAELILSQVKVYGPMLILLTYDLIRSSS